MPWAVAGINFIDSTPITACHNRRIHNHKVFASVAERGQCSIGWFYGFKLHLIINDKGEILSFYLTKGNVDDRNIKVMSDMTQNIFGKLFGDKGYISKALADLLWRNGIQMITKPRKSMKGFNTSQAAQVMLRKNFRRHVCRTRIYCLCTCKLYNNIPRSLL